MFKLFFVDHWLYIGIKLNLLSEFCITISHNKKNKYKHEKCRKFAAVNKIDYIHMHKKYLICDTNSTLMRMIKERNVLGLHSTFNLLFQIIERKSKLWKRVRIKKKYIKTRHIFKSCYIYLKPERSGFKYILQLLNNYMSCF